MKVCEWSNLSTLVSSRGHQESHTWQKPRKRFGGSTSSSALSSNLYCTRTRSSLLLTVPVLVRSFSLKNHTSWSLFVPPHLFLSLSFSSHPWKRYSRLLLPPDLLPCCPLLSCSSGLVAIPLKFLPLCNLHLWTHWRPSCLWVSSLPASSRSSAAFSVMSHSSSCCFCASDLGSGAVDWKGWEVQAQEWKRNLGAWNELLGQQGLVGFVCFGV